MKLCLLFHCLCESYEEAPQQGRELFVSLSDAQAMVEQLLERGYRFSPLEDSSPDTVTVTFDDGYYNNILFSEVSRSYNIPYIIFVSAYYVLSGEGFPWFLVEGEDYARMHEFDYYNQRGGLQAVAQAAKRVSDLTRPMTFKELEVLRSAGQVEIGCHGYYHQPLSGKYEMYTKQETDLALSALDENLGIRPRYFGLANGMYTRNVVRELLKVFERVCTSDGRPFRTGDKVIHRLSLINPNTGGPLVQQIDRSLTPIRQIRRAIRTAGRLWL